MGKRARRRGFAAVVCLAGFVGAAFGTPGSVWAREPVPAPEPAASVRYVDHAVLLRTSDGNFSARVQHRLQFRYATPFDEDPRTFGDLDRNTSSFLVRRARLRLRGHAFRPWLEWTFQYDWAQPVLRDVSLTLARFSWFKVLIGRRKVFWNDERVASSGQQQFVNRSIVNDLFTVDRQQGVQVFGRVLPGSVADLTYYAGVFSGRGVGPRNNDDHHMMYAGRLQWNALGGEMPFSQSDVEGHDAPVLNVAFGAATNISDCTAFETDARSCRGLRTPRADLTSFPNPETAGAAKPGQFQMRQAFAEFRLMWRGLYAKHEFHWKRVLDRTMAEGAAGRVTRLRGSLVQVGYFPHHLVPLVPRPLELAVRYAFVDPVITVPHTLQTESSAVINWFFDGHANKASFEVSRLTVADPAARATRAETRIRFQWDISF